MLTDFFALLFETPASAELSDGSPSSAESGSVHVFADAVVFFASAAIASILFVAIRRRRGASPTRAYFLCLAFVAVVGAMHGIEAAGYWRPMSGFSGGAKLVAALFAAIAAVATAAWSNKAGPSLPGSDSSPGTPAPSGDPETSVGDRSFRFAFEEAPIGITLAGADSRIERANPAYARLVGRDVESLAGVQTDDLTHPDDRALDEEVRRALLSGACSMSRVEKRLVRPNGAVVWAARTSSVFRERDGAPPLIISHVEDVTERRQALLELKRLNETLEARVAERTATLEAQADERRKFVERMAHAQRLESLGVLAGGVAHDFNNLLTAILGHAELAEIAPDGESTRAEFAAIKEACFRAAALTEQMLAYAGKTKLARERLDLADLVRRFGAILSVGVGRSARLEFRISTPPTVLGDSGQLGQVVLNLLTNASEAVGEGPGLIEVEVGASQVGADGVPGVEWAAPPTAGRYARLVVSDDGPGIDPAARPRMFEPFFTTKFLGRGLGLAAVLGVVRAHGGAIGISETRFRGARFIVLLPAVEEAAPSVSDVAKPAPETEIEGRRRVLVVDDESGPREVAAALLEAEGYEVERAGGGAEAAAIIARDPHVFDLVLLDLTMPPPDGGETFARIRRLRADLPVIVTSGYAESDALSRLVGPPPAGFLRKPYSRATLAQKARAALRS